MPKNYYDYEQELNKKQKEAEEKALRDLQTIPQYKDAYGRPMQSGSASLNSGPVPVQRTEFSQSKIPVILPKPDYTDLIKKEEPKEQTSSVMPGFDRSGFRKTSYTPGNTTDVMGQRETSAQSTPRRNPALDVVFPSERLSPEDQARFNTGRGMRIGWRPGVERGTAGSGMIIDEAQQNAPQQATPQEEKKTDWSKWAALIGSGLAGFGAGMQGRDVSQAFQSAYSPYEQRQQEKSAAEQRRAQAQAILARQTKGTPVSQDYAAMTYDLFPGVFQGLPRERVINGFSQEYLEKMLPEAMRMKIAQAQAASRKNYSQSGQQSAGDITLDRERAKIFADVEKDYKQSLAGYDETMKMFEEALDLIPKSLHGIKYKTKHLGANFGIGEDSPELQNTAYLSNLMGFKAVENLKRFFPGQVSDAEGARLSKLFGSDSSSLASEKIAAIKNLIKNVLPTELAKKKNIYESYLSDKKQPQQQEAPDQTTPAVSAEERNAAIKFLRSKGIDDPNDDEIERAAAMMRAQRQNTSPERQASAGNWNGGRGVQRSVSAGNGRD